VRMKEYSFLFLVLLCQLVVTEELLSRKEKEEEEGKRNNQMEVGDSSLQIRNSLEETVRGRASKESEKRELGKGESEGRRGPPRLRKAMEVVVGRVGQEVKLVCPITGNPTPIIEWEKDGEVVDYTWTRVKTNKNYLKLRGAKLEDTGIFYCRGVNGFGSVRVRVELIVTDSSSEDLKVAAPMFTLKTKSQQKFVKKLPGAKMSLVCEALGSPRPSILWSLDGKTLSSRPNLVIPSLSESNSGVYTCVASNLAGSAKVDFSVTVESPRVELPSIGELGNVSAMVGEAAVLQCKVTSSLPPSVQWLRKVEDIQQEATLTLANMQLISVSQNQDTRTVNLPEGNYLDTLVIDRVTPEDAGLYVCFATNTAGGFNYQSAHLRVVEMETGAEEGVGEEVFLGLVVGLVSVVLLLLAVIVLCLARGRHKLLLPEFGDSQRSIVYQASRPYREESWSLQKPPLQPSLPSGNIYDLPYTHAQARATPHQVVHYSPLPIHSPTPSHATRMTSLPSSTNRTNSSPRPPTIPSSPVPPSLPSSPFTPGSQRHPRPHNRLLHQYQ